MLKRKEFIFLFIIALICGISVLFFHLNSQSSQKLYVVVSHQDENILCVPLDEDLTKEIQTEEGYNILVVKEQKVYIESADCKNQICVQTSPIDEPGETIACLPHHLIVEIKQENNLE